MPARQIDPVNEQPPQHDASHERSEGSGGATTPKPAKTPVAGRKAILTLLAAFLVAVLLGALVSVALGPRATLADPRSGDATLIRDTEAALGSKRGLQTLSVARVENGKPTFAGLGGLETDDGDSAPNPHTTYELGSITKTWTGMLLADAVKRGEMKLDAPLATHLPELKGTPAGAATLEQLATHTSGLPRLPEDDAWGTALAVASNDNPYAGWDAERVIKAAGSAQLETPGTLAYSNLGMALLGLAEARAAGASEWAELAQQRILTPLGMTETFIVDEDDANSSDLATPHLANGQTTAGWGSTGYAPAGSSTRTTAADMATFAAAVIEGRAPGAEALKPRAEASQGRKIGLAWFTDTDDSGSLVWHNGGTGGSSSIIALDPATKTGLVALSNSATNIDHVGVGLLRPSAEAPAPKTTPWSWFAVALAIVLALAPWWRGWRAEHRIGLASAVIDAGAGAVLAWTRGAWNVVPEWLLGSILAVAFVGSVYALMRMRDVPTWPVRGRITAIVSLVISLAILAFFALAL